MNAYRDAVEAILSGVAPLEPEEADPSSKPFPVDLTFADTVQTRDGRLLLAEGVRLSPARLAALRMAGIESPWFHPRPKIACVFPTIAREADALDFERASVSPTIDLLLGQIGAASSEPGSPPGQMRTLTKPAWETDDLVVLVADGLTGDDLREMGGHVLLDGAAIRPGGDGMLLAVRALEDQSGRAHYLLALPDDPAAALVGWVMLGAVIVNRLMGRPEERCRPPVVLAMSEGEVSGNDERTMLVPAVLRPVNKFTAWRVQPLGAFGGGASDAHLLARTNALIVRAPGAGPLPAGAVCDVVPLVGDLGALP